MTTVKEILLENKRSLEKSLAHQNEHLLYLHEEIVTTQSQKAAVESTIENIDQALVRLEKGE